MNWTQYKAKVNREITTETKRNEDIGGIKYDVFVDPPEELQLKDSDIGSRVWISDMKKSTKAFIKSIDRENDIVEIKIKGEIPRRHFGLDQALLHPDEWTKKRLDFKQTFETKFT